MSVFCAERAPKPLLPLEDNLRKFEQLGADGALVVPFTRAFAATAPEVYLKELVAGMRAVGVVVGQNYTFGSQGRGDAALIQSLAEALDYRAVIVDSVMDGGRMVSSTAIRELLCAGEIERARRLMEISEPS
jgi:riboflavin kinase/FMN adenylyltransferase